MQKLYSNNARLYKPKDQHSPISADEKSEYMKLLITFCVIGYFLIALSKNKWIMNRLEKNPKNWYFYSLDT